jgi:hypothetical protein
MIPLDQQSLSLIAIRMKKRTTVSKMVFRLHQISAAVFVAGCSVGPRYRQPLLKLQPYQNAPAVGSLSAGLSVPPLDIWREGFNNPTLTKIVERALAQNLDLAASFARVEQARAAAQEAGANRKPSFDLPGSDAASRRSVATPIGRAESGVLPGFNRNQNVVDLGIGASWEADVFGGLRWGSEAANAEAQAAEAERFGARVSVVAKAADAYLQIRGTQVRLAFAKEQIETHCCPGKILRHWSNLQINIDIGGILAGNDLNFISLRGLDFFPGAATARMRHELWPHRVFAIS